MKKTTLNEILNTDFCPWANQYVYWLKKPLGILVVAAMASLLCGLFVAPQGLVIAATIAATIVLGMVWPWVGLRGISCELRFSQRRGVEGQASPVEVIIRNRWPFPVWGLAIEEGFFLTQADEDGTAIALSGIRGWSKTKFCWDFQPDCRGIYPTKTAKIATEFPFGVWKARRDIDTAGKLTVWPRTVALEPAVLADGPNRSLLRPSDKRSGNEGDRIGVRAYREGDSLRFVHWAQTAKCGRLIVSERQGPAQASAVIAIDSDPNIAHGTGSQSSFETSIRIAASLCEQLARQNVSVLVTSNRESWEVHPTELSRHASLDRLAAISNTKPLEVAAAETYDERFVITTSSQKSRWGAGWKVIVLDLREESHSVSFADHNQIDDQVGEWIRVDDSASSMTQFAERWKRAVRFAWRGTERRAGVA